MDASIRERILELSKSNEELREAFEAHHGFEKKIAKMEKKRVLSEDEKLQKKELKILKLSKKDEIERILSEDSQ